MLYENSESIKSRIAKKALLINYRIRDFIRGRCSGFNLNTTTLYKIDPIVDEAPRFKFYFDFNSPHIRRRIVGDYETEVVKKYSNILNKNKIFWEVGAAWGYHSLMAAQIASQVVSFEPNKDRNKLLKKSCDKNNLHNISLVSDEVDSLDNYLNEFDTPDVILIDVDGWEYEIIPSSSQLLSLGCIWIVELHHDVDVPPAENNTPDEIKKLFKEHNYYVDTIQKRGSLNWRGKEDNSLNTEHIIACPDDNGSVQIS